MSQLLVVHGRDAEAVRAVTDDAVELFAALCGVRAADRLDARCTSIVVFPRMHADRAPSIARDEEGRWAAAAGVYFPEDAATALASNDRFASRVAGLEGIFVAAAGDDRTAAVATDRLGSLHAYQSVVRGCVVVATSSMVLAALGSREWDLDGCRDFLATGTVFESRTLFRGIEKLEPATIHQLRDGVVAERTRYWVLPAVLNDGAPSRDDATSLADALRGAVETAVRAHPNAAFDLTGGYDSRAVLGAALRTNAVRNTVVVGRDRDPDVVVSSAIAREYHLDHEQHRPDRDAGEWWRDAKRALALCDGEYDVLEYANILAVHERLASRFDASVNGSNGEICRGFWWGLLFPRAGERGHFDARKVAAARFLAEPQAADLLEARFDEPLLDHFEGAVRRATAGLEHHPNTAHMDAVYLTMRMQRWQGRIASATSRIWPSVSPFVFREPMEIALGMPAAMRLRNRMARRLIAQLDPRLAAMPLAQGYPAEPLGLRNVYRFWPAVTELWSRGRKKLPIVRAQTATSANPLLPLWREPEVADLLDPSRMRTASLYEPARLRAFLSAARAQTFGRIAQLGRVLTLELLARAVAT